MEIKMISVISFKPNGIESNVIHQFRLFVWAECFNKTKFGEKYLRRIYRKFGEKDFIDILDIAPVNLILLCCEA